MASLMRIGLTGGIASGKSTVAGRFAELGVPVVDADNSAHAVVAPGTPGLAAVVRRFGTRILLDSGALDRAALRREIFADPARRAELESILHPLIRIDMEEEAAKSSGPYLIMAIPLLIEGGDLGRVQRVLVVDLDEDVQLARLVARDGGSQEQARQILMAQATRAQRLGLADDVLLNTGTISDLREEVDQLHKSYIALTKSGDPPSPAPPKSKVYPGPKVGSQ